MIEIRTTASPILKAQLRAKDDRQQLMLAVRVYRNSKLIDRFNYYVKDYGQPVYLHKKELASGFVTNHKMDIRYNELLTFLKIKLQEILNAELTSKTIISREVVKASLDNSVKSQFNSVFLSKINEQNIIIKSSGYNNIDDFEVDSRALDSYRRIKIPTEPTVDPLGQVELNDHDAGDLEIMLINEDLRLRLEAEQIRISKMNTEERYRLGEYDKLNIFQLFGSIYYNKELSSTYDKIALRLYEYRYYMKPNENVNNFDEYWVTEFMTFLWNHGYTNLNSVRFDPLKFNEDIFINKPIKKYKASNLYKLLEVVQTVSNHFADRGLLRRIDFKKIDVEKICGIEKSEEGSRIEHNLDFQEFNHLFFYKFDPKKLSYYQNIFDSKKVNKENGKVRFKNLKISIKDLETARDLFCIQVMAGGIRGYKDLMTSQVNKDYQQLSFYVKKLKGSMINPFNVYTQIVAKDHKYQLPKYSFSYSKNSMEGLNRTLCQTIANILPFDREVLYEDELIKIKDLFNPYFARKTFAQMMYDEFDFSEEEISIFTGHSTNRKRSVLSINYVNVKSIAKKKKLFKRITLPHGKTLSTKRTF